MREDRFARYVATAALVIVSAVYIVYVWDRYVFSVELVEVRRALKMGLGSASFLASVFTFGLAAVAIPAGFITRKVGTRWTLVGGAVLFSLATGYTAFGHGLGDITPARIISGVGEGLFNVALFTYLGSITARRKGSSIGLGASLFGIGALTGPLLVAGLLGSAGRWQVPFVILAALGLVGAVAIVIITRGAHIAKPDPQPLDLRSMMRLRHVPVYLLMAVNGLGIYGIIALYETFLRTQQGFSLGTASLVVSLNGVGQIVGGTPLGYLADTLGRRSYLVVASVCALVFSAALFLEPASLALACATAFCFGAASNSIYTNCYALMQEQVERQQAAIATGVLATIYFLLAAFSGPILIAAKSALGWKAAGVVVFGAAYAAGAVAISFAKLRPGGLEPTRGGEVTAGAGITEELA